MALSYHNFSKWDMDQVSQWLGQIHLTSLIPNFERLGITGNDLMQMDEAFMKETLRISKPLEIVALRGAIMSLIDSAQAPQVPQWKAGRPQSMATNNLERSSSFETPVQNRSLSHPTTLPRNYTMGSAVNGRKELTFRPPQLLSNASAPTLLDDNCRYSGWIRKQGGGYKNWKRRYMILRLGCLYYFANETAAHAKGSFTLSGYKTEICHDPKITEKYKWTLKLTPINPAMRTYYIALGAKMEMEYWRTAIDEEISASVKRTSTVSSPGSIGSSTTFTAPATLDEEGSDDDDDDDENIYDEPEGGDVEEEDPYSTAGDPSGIYDDPERLESDDDPYDEILEACPPPHLAQIHTSPSHGPGVPLAVRSFKDINKWEVAPAHRGITGKDGAPSIPMRSAVSLGLDKASSKSPNASPILPRGESSAAGALVNENEASYLTVLGSGSASGTPEPSDRSRVPSPPVEGIPNLPVAEALQGPKTIMRGGRAIILPTTDKADEFDRDYEDDSSDDNEDGGPYEGDSDAYYILFRKPEELMPPSCVFDRLDRDDANRLLRSTSRDRTYLIRAGQHAGSEKVLSVWHEDKCRHYKLFKDENSHYSLTQGQTFKTIPELLQYYALQSHLPKSDFYLGDPYHPADH